MVLFLSRAVALFYFLRSLVNILGPILFFRFFFFFFFSFFFCAWQVPSPGVQSDVRIELSGFSDIPCILASQCMCECLRVRNALLLMLCHPDVELWTSNRRNRRRR